MQNIVTFSITSAAIAQGINISHYLVQFTDGGGNKLALTESCTFGSSTCQLTNLTAGQQYCLTIAAVGDKCGTTSSPSNSLCFNTMCHTQGRDWWHAMVGLQAPVPWRCPADPY